MTDDEKAPDPTGYYVRTQVGERWEPIDFALLTDPQLEAFIERHPNDGWIWAKAMQGEIRRAYTQMLARRLDRRAKGEE